MALMGKHSPPLDGVTLANGHRDDADAAVAHLRTFGALMHPQQAQSPLPLAQDAGSDEEKRPGWRHAVAEHRGWFAAVPVVLVNAVAFGAQLGFWRAHVPLAAEAVLVALALESIAVYLAWQAHLAQLADDSALRLRLAAYGMALLIGALNYSHFMLPGWRPTVEAVTFGMMSAISPWLWSVHSRRVSRDALKARGLIEPHAVRLGGTRWAWHPWRSVCVMSAATWAGETDPVKAIAAWRPHAAEVPAAITPSPVPGADAVPSPDAPEARREAFSEGDGVPSSSPLRSDAKPEPRTRPARPSLKARAITIMRAHPGITNAEVMKRTGASSATVERARKELNGAKP